MTTIPKASINDLLAASNTANPSASLKGPITSNPVSDFISMLAKYAQPVESTIENTAKNTAKNVDNSLAAPVRDIGAYTRIQFDPQAKQQLDAINNSNLSEDQKIDQGNKLMQQYGGQTPQQSESATQGSEFGMGFTAPGGAPAMGGLEGNLGYIARQGVDSAKKIGTDVAETVGQTIENAKLQPGGLQAGFVKVPGVGKEGGLPPITEAAPKVEKPAMITKNKLDDDTLKRMRLNFDVTRVKSQNAMIHPDTVFAQLIDDGVTGRSLNDLQSTAENITGRNAAFPMINDYILSTIKDPIDYSSAIKSLKTNLPAVLEGEKPGFINGITNEISKQMQPLNYNIPGELPSSLPEGQAYAKDLFQTSQNLRDIARMYLRKAYTQTGELNHPEFERAADAVMEIKNNIDGAINKAVPSDVYQSFKTDPYVLQQLQRVPPKISQRWLEGAEKFKDGQTIQAPYYNLLDMIDDTKDTQMSVWTKTAKAMQQQNTSGTVGNVVKENIPGPKIVKNIAGGIAEKATKPFDKTPEDIFEENMGGKKPGGNPPGGSGPGGETPNGSSGGGKTAKVIAGLGLAGALGAGLEHLQSASNAKSKDHTDNSNNSHLDNNTAQDNNSQIETDMNKIDISKPAVDPRSVTGSDGNSLAMDEGKYQTAIAQLDALTKTDPSYITNPIKSGQLAAAKDAIEKKHSASQQLMKSYQNVQTVSQKIANAQSLLEKASPKLTDKVGFLEGAHEIFDPKYQSLVNDLKFIENSDPRLKGQLSNLGTKQSVQTALDNAAKLLLSEHNQLLKSYGAGTTKTTPAPTQTPPPSQLPAGLPAPVNGALPQLNNGSYQFTEPNPMFQ